VKIELAVGFTRRVVYSSTTRKILWLKQIGALIARRVCVAMEAIACALLCKAFACPRWKGLTRQYVAKDAIFPHNMAISAVAVVYTKAG
jgi:hypothetical protein